MTKDVVKKDSKKAIIGFDRNALASAISSAARAVKKSEEEVLGPPFLRFSEGSWYLGSTREEIPEGTEVVALPQTLQSGFVAWVAGQIDGEVMKPLVEGPVDPNTLPPTAAKRGWEPQLGLEFLFLDDGTKAEFKSSSMGGRRAVGSFIKELNEHFEAGEPGEFPVVTLGSGSYIHRENGKIFFPVLKIVRWLTQEEMEDLLNRFED